MPLSVSVIVALFKILNFDEAHCNGYAKKCPQKPKFDGHRFDFLSIIPKVYYSFEHIMLKSSIVFKENVQKFDLHDSNFEPNWMKSTKLLYSL